MNSFLHRLLSISKLPLFAIIYITTNNIAYSNNLDSTIFSGKLKTIESIIYNPSQATTASNLIHNLLDSSLSANFSEGIAWGKYYLSLWLYERYNIDSSIYYSKDAYNEFLKINNYTGQTKALTSLGRAYHFIPIYDSSLFYLRMAEEIAITKSNDSSLLINTYRFLANDYTYIGDHENALQYNLKALHLAQKYENMIMEASILNSMGVLLRRRGDMHNSLDFHYKSLDLFEKVNNAKGIAYEHNNIGLILIELEEYNKALNHFNQSLEIKKGNNDRFGISNSLLNIGIVYTKNKKYDIALSYYKQSESIKKELNDLSGIAQIYLRRGETYQHMEQFDKSIRFLNLAIENFQSCNEIKPTVTSMLQLATTYYKMKEYDKALNMTNNAAEINSKNPMEDIYVDIYKIYYDIYNAKHDNQNALLYLQKYISLRDSASNINNLKKLLSVQMQSEFDKVLKKHTEQSDIKLQNAKRIGDKNARIAILFSIAFGFTIVVLILLMITIKNKQQINKQLKSKQEEIEDQKQELIAQRDNLEIQKNLVIYQRDRIINILTDLGDSINYAKRIQQAIFPSEKVMTECFTSYFIINKPKEQVGGDFYWAGTTNNQHLVFAAADSTGHGIPGGFMSMLGMSMIAEIVARNTCPTPADALNELRSNIITTLDQNGMDNDIVDGMDISFCVYEPENQKLTYAGANLSVYVSTQQELKSNDRITQFAENLYEIKPDRMPISYFDTMNPFNNIDIQLNSNDTVYLFSDGFTDQFGGVKGKKFGHNAFRNLIFSIKDLPLDQQKQMICTTIENWMGETENQTDDILVMGIKLP